MPLTLQAQHALRNYASRADAGTVQKLTIYKALKLTQKQRVEIEQHLIQLWSNPSYTCPQVLDLKPMHGYQSRVLKDRFQSADYVSWLIEGCSELAYVHIDERERPRLQSGLRLDFEGIGYSLHVPIRSDAKGAVYVDDVIPKGLQPGTQKRNSPLG